MTPSVLSVPLVLAIALCAATASAQFATPEIKCVRANLEVIHGVVAGLGVFESANIAIELCEDHLLAESMTKILRGALSEFASNETHLYRRVPNTYSVNMAANPEPASRSGTYQTGLHQPMFSKITTSLASAVFQNCFAHGSQYPTGARVCVPDSPVYLVHQKSSLVTHSRAYLNWVTGKWMNYS